MKAIQSGVYPTMITPYNKDGSVDFGAAEALTEWFWLQGCDGVFAVCLSSEIFELSLEERVGLAETVQRTASRLAAQNPGRPPMSVVASGHISDSLKDQVRELNRIADAGVDAVVLISNRFDPERRGFAEWKRNAEHILSNLPAELTLGIYECPHPYKRELDAELLDWVVRSGRFAFIKDTCCNAELIANRLAQLSRSGVKLFNAHTESLLQTLRAGADGYCGVMANYIPRPFKKLYDCWKDDPWLADYLQAFLTYAQTSEGMGYPVSAKYYLKELEHLPMTLLSRTVQESALTDRYRACLSQLHSSVASLTANRLI